MRRTESVGSILSLAALLFFSDQISIVQVVQLDNTSIIYMYTPEQVTIPDMDLK